MALLKPIQSIASELTQALPPSRECEGCGKVISVGDAGINVIHVIQVGSPGHPGVPPFQCPALEHWACSPACWAKVAHACIDEHITPLLSEVHDRLHKETLS